MPWRARKLSWQKHFPIEAPSRDLGISGLALKPNQIVILQFQVVQLIEKIQRDGNRGRMAAVLYSCKLAILFKPLHASSQQCCSISHRLYHTTSHAVQSHS